MDLSCVFCETVIKGRYSKHPKIGVYCEPCNRGLPKCAKCGLTHLAKDSSAEGLCGRCSGDLKPCATCGGPLIGGHRTIRSKPGLFFCKACAEAGATCDFCGCPCAGAPHVYDDGRESCGACRETAVCSDTALLQLESRARAWLHQRLGFSLLSVEDCPVQLVNARQMAEVQQKAFKATPGFDARERGLFARRSLITRQGVDFVSQVDQLSIYIESGLPESMCYGTVVHELVHLWQHEAFPRRPVHRQYREGLACWAQYHALKAIGAEREAEALVQSTDPIYGGGLRMMLEIEQNTDFANTVAALVLRVGGGRWQPSFPS